MFINTKNKPLYIFNCIEFVKKKIVKTCIHLYKTQANEKKNNVKNHINNNNKK